MRSFCINILGKKYTVQLVKGDADKKTIGSCEYTKQLIKISSVLGPNQLTETLLHEIIHAIEGEMNLKLKEGQVRSLSIGLFQVLRDNPRLIRMIKSNVEVLPNDSPSRG